jgi:DNA-binding SARP family transcriptional activator
MVKQRLIDRPILHGRIHIRLLGGFALSLGGKPVAAINSLRLQSLLAYLLLHRSAPQTRQHIAFLFWPDSSEAQAQSNLRNLLVTLRRALPESDHYLSMDRQTLQWHDGEHLRLDVAEFESALANAERVSNQISGFQRAVDLWP